MTPDEWRRVTAVFHDALAREPSALAAFLDEACAGQQDVRAEVDRLLVGHRAAGRFGDAPMRMTLAAGTRFGQYEIHSALGAGGMGEVYRARDTKLGRDIAIKVLPTISTTDPERRARFEREARLLAALNHPHIGAIYGFEEADGIQGLVLELIEGPTLAERLTQGPLPISEALTIASQIADALEAAHESGIVHRDLKPANVKVTPGGVVKVLDFGLAKAWASGARRSDPTSSPPTTVGGTREGVIVGTAAYMSPEQARGQAVDKRTDVWAFGCVLYEMLTGKPVFEGAELPDTMVEVLRAEPDWAAMPAGVPAPILALLQGCLRKNRNERISDLSTARFLLRHVETLAVAPVVSSWPARRWGLVAVAALGVLFSSIALWWPMDQRTGPQLLQAALLSAPGTVLQASRGFALSPDGTRLAFIASDMDGVTRLWVRSLAAVQALPLRGTEGARSPFWSPDGRDIGFFADERLKRVPATGGTVQSLGGPTLGPKGGAWSPDGRIVYAPHYGTGLFEVPASGGDSRALTALDVDQGEISHRWPQFLPDGRTLLFLVQTAEAGTPDDRSRIEALDASGTRHRVLSVNASAAYGPSGQLLFARDRSIYSQEFDAQRLRLSGESKLIAKGAGLTAGEWAAFTVSDGGTLVYHDASTLSWRLEWRDRSGRLLSVAAPNGEYSQATLSGDGRRVAYLENNIALWVLDLARGTNTRLTFENVDHMSPAWSAKGDWLAYAANKPKGPGSEIYRRQPSGLGQRETLYSSENIVRELSWAPDGRSIAFRESGNIFILDVESRQARIRIDTPGTARGPRFSPDGRWLAYSSDESGRDQVYVVPAFGGSASARVQVSSRGGFNPEWGTRGDELFFVGSEDAITVARVSLGSEGEFGVPETLFPLTGASQSPGTSYRIGSNGTIFIRAHVESGDSQSFTLILNWPELVK